MEFLPRMLHVSLQADTERKFNFHNKSTDMLVKSIKDWRRKRVPVSTWRLNLVSLWITGSHCWSLLIIMSYDLYWSSCFMISCQVWTDSESQPSCQDNTLASDGNQGYAEWQRFLSGQSDEWRGRSDKHEALMQVVSSRFKTNQVVLSSTRISCFCCNVTVVLLRCPVTLSCYIVLLCCSVMLCHVVMVVKLRCCYVVTSRCYVELLRLLNDVVVTLLHHVVTSRCYGC